MILELIQVSRLKRELNKVIRKLNSAEVDVYIVSMKGRRVAYLMAPERFHDWIHRIDHADSEEAIRLNRELNRLSKNDVAQNIGLPMNGGNSDPSAQEKMPT